MCLEQTSCHHGNLHSPDAVASDDHEVVVVVERQDFDVGHAGDHLLLWRQVLVPLVEVVTWKGEG